MAEAPKVDNIGKIDLPKVDVTKHIGKIAHIVNVTIEQGEFGHYVKIETTPVETLGSGDKQFDLKGTKLFNLQKDKNGVVGYGEDTKLGVFLKKMKCKKLTDLVGKEVILQSQTSKKGTEFLTFN